MNSIEVWVNFCKECVNLTLAWVRFCKAWVNFFLVRVTLT